MRLRGTALLGVLAALGGALVLGGGVEFPFAAPPAAAAAPAASPSAEVRIYGFKDGPPPRVTGGFGEDSCVACHWDDENDGLGMLKVTGFPEYFEPGERYPIGVVLVREGMQVAGFQLAARYEADTSQAGRFEVPSHQEARVAVTADREVEFAQHRLDGTELSAPDRAGWKVDWVAPDAGGVVVVHVSAVAGDGDESQLGDYVYTIEVRTRPVAGASYRWR